MTHIYTRLVDQQPYRAMAIGAHPDDIEFQCGATLAHGSSLGWDITMVVCTDGSKGTWDPQADIAQLVARRASEQQAAAAVLGANRVEFLDAVDGELENSAELRAALVTLIRTLRPHLVLAHDPWKMYRLHPDHRAAGWLSIDAVVAARDPHFFAELGLSPHRPDRLLLFEAESPNVAEPVTAHDVDCKVSALMAHESQLETTHFYRSDAEAKVVAFARQHYDSCVAVGRRYGADLAEEFREMTGL